MRIFWVDFECAWQNPRHVVASLQKLLTGGVMRRPFGRSHTVIIRRDVHRRFWCECTGGTGQED
jgi:hypothetical protein